MIHLERVTATKGRFRLTEISFALEAGAYGVVIGPAGSGKTTLLEALAGLIRVTGGQVRIDGVDQRRMSPESRDRKSTRLNSSHSSPSRMPSSA